MAHRSRYGSGSIRPKGEGRWELRVSAGRDPATGRNRYVSRTVRGSKREAEAALAALLVGVTQGRALQTTDDTVRDLVEQWLDLRRETLSVTTYEAYLAKARFRLLPALRDVPVRKLGVRDIDARYRTIIEKDTKTHQARRVAIDAGTVAALRAWRAEVERRAEIADVPLRPTASSSAPSPTVRPRGAPSTGPARGGACGRRPVSTPPFASMTLAAFLEVAHPLDLAPVGVVIDLGQDVKGLEDTTVVGPHERRPVTQIAVADARVAPCHPSCRPRPDRWSRPGSAQTSCSPAS